MSECVVWPHGKTTSGYGSVWMPGRNNSVRVHRVAYELINGPIPKGMVVMHTCDNPACYNIEHLKLGSQADNLRDMAAKGRHWNQKTHCKRGHEFTKQNTEVYDGGRRRCKTCRDKQRQLRRH